MLPYGVINDDDSASVASTAVKAGHSKKNEETRLDAFEMEGLRKILQISWTAKKTNEWVFDKAGVKRELLDTVKVQGTMPGTRR